MWFRNWPQTCWLTFRSHLYQPWCQACSIVSICPAASVLPLCSSQPLCFMGRRWQDLRACHAPFRALSPQHAAFSASLVFRPYLVCKWVVRKTKHWVPEVTIRFPPSVPWPPSPSCTHPPPKGSWRRDEARSLVLPETLFLLPGSAMKSELWCLSGDALV